jgi:hypothetical protein
MAYRNPCLTPQLCSKRPHRLSKHILRNRKMSSTVQVAALVYISCLLGWAQSVTRDLHDADRFTRLW